MTLETEDEIIAFVEYLTGLEATYLGSEMSTWVFKEHHLKMAGHETPSLLVISGNGEYILFDKLESDDRVQLHAGHIEDTPFGTGRSKQLVEFAGNVTGHELQHSGYVDFSGLMRGSVLVPKDRSEDHSFFLIEGPSEISVFRGANPMQFLDEDEPIQDIKAPSFNEAPFWTGSEDRFDDPSIHIGCTLNITDVQAFLAQLEAASLAEVGASHLPRIATLHDLPAKLGLSRIDFGNIEVDGSQFHFEIHANVSDWKILCKETRAQYGSCWGDGDWYPESPEDALFEIALASNANDSPDIYGFEILDWRKVDPIKPEETPEP